MRAEGCEMFSIYNGITLHFRMDAFLVMGSELIIGNACSIVAFTVICIVTIVGLLL